MEGVARGLVDPLVYDFLRLVPSNDRIFDMRDDCGFCVWDEGMVYHGSSYYCRVNRVIRGFQDGAQELRQQDDGEE